MAPLKTAWYYYPNNRGLVSGIVLFGYGISAFMFNLICDHIINPKSQNVLADKLYSEEVSNRVPLYFITIIILFAIQVSVGIVLLFPYVPEDTIDEYTKVNL